MARRIICNSCGAEFEDWEPKCPYCGTMNYKGAELEYFEKLEDVRENMEELKAVPLEETKKEIKKQGKFIKKVVIFIIAFLVVLFGWQYLMNKRYERDEKADYIWKVENFYIMDEMYEAGEYEELAEFYWKASEEDKPVYLWEHAGFVELFSDLERFYADLAYMEEKKSQGEELSVTDYKWILWQQLLVVSDTSGEWVSQEDKEIFAEDIAVVEEYLKNGWGFDEETYEKMYKQATEGECFVSSDDCEKYIKEWLEKGER